MPPWASSPRSTQRVTLTNTSVHYPGGVTYKNGQKCAAGTPDAGKVGVVRARSWTLSTASQKSGSETKLVGGKYTSKPAGLKLRNSQLITVGFGPSTKALPKVPVGDGSGSPPGDQWHLGSGDDDHRRADHPTTAASGTTTTTTASGTTTTTSKSATTTTTAKSSG